MLRDDFAERLAALTAAGWIVTDYARYDPTHVVGLTPSGKTFTLHAEAGTVTIDVAGRTKTVNVAKATWEPAEGLIQAWLSAHQALPVNQR